MRPFYALVLLAVVAAIVPATAQAHDSLAPRGALHSWLPREDWVYRHWLPFDEWRLKQRLGLSGRQLESYLMNDHRSLAALAHRRGLSVRRLADELIAPLLERTRVDPDVLRDRATRVLTQGHLAQHMFFHPYHGLDMRTPARAVFGLDPDAYYDLRKAGGTPAEAARLGGRSVNDVRAAMRAAFGADFHEGTRLGVADPVEQQIMLTRREAQLECWLGRPLPTFDPGHPYGDRFKFHGRHTSAPRTPSERVRDDRRVRRGLRRLPRSCWSPAPPWSEHGGGRAVVARRSPAATPRPGFLCAPD